MRLFESGSNFGLKSGKKAHKSKVPTNENLRVENRIVSLLCEIKQSFMALGNPKDRHMEGVIRSRVFGAGVDIF